MQKFADDVKLIGRVGSERSVECWANENGFGKLRSLGKEVANEVQ